MSWGMQLMDDFGNVIVDTTLISGGVIATVATYLAADTATMTFPVFAGRAIEVIPLSGFATDADFNVLADVALGYPRVTVGAGGTNRRFMVVVF